MRFRKKSKCVSGRVKIISAIKLDANQVSDIIDIVNNIITQELYEPSFHISRNVYHLIGNVSLVKTWITKNGRKIIIKLTK